MRLRFGLIGLVSASVLFTVGYVLSEYAGLYAPFSAFGKLRVEGIPLDLAAESEKITTTPAEERLSPGIALSVKRVDFGYVPIGIEEREFTVKLTNTGNAPLRISEIEVPPGPFLLSRCPVLPAVIGPGVRVTFGISLSPVTRGLASATAAIITNAPTGRVEIPLEAVVGGPADPVAAEDSNERRLNRTSRPLVSAGGESVRVLPRVVKGSVELPVFQELSEALQWIARADSSTQGQIAALGDDDSSSSEERWLPSAARPEAVADSGLQMKILSPPDGTIVSGAVSVRGELKTEDEISDVTLEIDGQKLQAEYKQNGPILEITFDSRSLTEGPHKVLVEVLGKLGGKTVVALTLWVANGSEGRPK